MEVSSPRKSASGSELSERNKRTKSDASFEDSIKTESLSEDIQSGNHDNEEEDIDALLKDNDISWVRADNYQILCSRRRQLLGFTFSTQPWT